jgi:hypothetical protein
MLMIVFAIVLAGVILRFLPLIFWGTAAGVTTVFGKIGEYSGMLWLLLILAVVLKSIEALAQ